MFRSIKYFVSQHIAFDEFSTGLMRFGYARVKSVAQEGEYAIRGEVIDIFPSGFDSPLRIDSEEGVIRKIFSFQLSSGKNVWEHEAVIIFPVKGLGPDEVFQEDMPLTPFVDIHKGDYVVHNQHGIGRFIGLKEFAVDLKQVEHFVIEYQGGDKLFVPQKDLHLVQKYIGFTKKPPRLFRLGSREWEKIRKTIEKRLQRLASELLHVQALRNSMTGFACTTDNEWQSEFEKTFPFIETPDQGKAASEVKADMESTRPMDRLLCGDVGYGKTEVAMRAAFKAVMNAKQVAILVPTTVLAEQHYLNFSRRMKAYPVRIGMVSRFRSRNEQIHTIKETAEGRVDIIIGTHRLLSKDVHFKDLGLIIIDEEQRFGVTAKERLKHMKLLCDVLTMTATPIPRTLYMAMVSCRDMSVISTPPSNRIPVTTEIICFEEDIIRLAIERELARGGQVFFLHNHVEDIISVAAKIAKLVPKARLGIGHGQMPGKDLENVMLDFLKGEIDVLVCTTIIESGIDIPNANTLIVNKADRFGLSDLHQLRGRVGRTNIKAYAYFIVPDRSILSGVARKRMEVLQKFSDLGAGFHIAFEDLQIRGAGNLLGEQQHGYISNVGFDLYCRMLKGSIENLKKEMARTNAK